MFNDTIMDLTYRRYLESELKHRQKNLDTCLNNMRLNENNNNTLGYVYSTIFLENAKAIKEIGKLIQELKDKEKKNYDKNLEEIQKNDK